MLLFMAGAGLSLLTCLIFTLLWNAFFRRRGGRGFGTLMNGAGFGLLPAIAVWKSFEPDMTGVAASAEADRMWTPGTLSFLRDPMPARPELFLILLCFLALSLWVILRKEDLTGNGDVLAVSATLWSTVTWITEPLHGEAGFRLLSMNVRFPVAFALMLLCLALWIWRGSEEQKNTGYALACVLVFLGGAVMTALLRTGRVTTGSGTADFAIQAGCALLAMKAVLCMGRVSRRE